MQTILACLLSAVVMQAMITVESSPYTVPYRRPTQDEVANHIPIRVSNGPISDVDTAVEKRVIEYLVEKKYLLQYYLDLWNSLKGLQELTPQQATDMYNFKQRKARAIRKFQMDHSLPVTGVVDNGIREIIFGSICGTADVDDYEDEKKN